MRITTLSVFLLANAGLSAAQTDNANDDAFQRSRAAIAEAVRLAGEDKSRCEQDRRTVRYAGRTDLGLYACLYEAVQSGAQHLTITSFGGPVVNAIPAADIIARHGMSVSVLGICGSSCGNYLAPAATRLGVLPYSLISVHGAPHPPDERKIREALRKAGNSREQIRMFLGPNLRRGRFEYALHQAFQRRHGIHDGLYDADALRSAQVRLRGMPMLYLSRETMSACAPNLHLDMYWEPESQDDEARLEQLFPNSSRGEYGALSDGRVCRETGTAD
ncbi:hypothetical protein [Henriciella sp.]|uniref:hypothetical protein n=1 Tax=Henriciella sp. TaxID=1968823 RepID=UPI00260364F3|nr:hypothetical protein [Henriciella sp.]